MNTTTVNISFQRELLSEIDAMARDESRSRSELLREAVRSYISQKKRWEKIFKYGETVAKKQKLREGDVASEIQAYRKQKAARP